MMPVIDQGQNDHNGLSVGKENMCHCDLSCYLENVFPWNFCNSHSLQTKGTSKYKWPNGQIQIKPPPSCRFKQLLVPRFLKLGQKVKSVLETCLGCIHLWYNAIHLHGNAPGMCKVGSSLQTAMAYRADMLSFYLKIVWVTSVLCAISDKGAWRTCLTSQNRRGTRSVESVDFLLQTGLSPDAERAWLELSCLWTHLLILLASDLKKNWRAPNGVVRCDVKACSKASGPKVSLWTQIGHSAWKTPEAAFSNLWRVLVLYSLSETTSRKHSGKSTLLCLLKKQYHTGERWSTRSKQHRPNSASPSDVLWSNPFVKWFWRFCVRKLWSGQGKGSMLIVFEVMN